jgi:hypothetical protein
VHHALCPPQAPRRVGHGVAPGFLARPALHDSARTSGYGCRRSNGAA